MNIRNIILNTDSYKPSHFMQMPEGTEYAYAYISARGHEYDVGSRNPDHKKAIGKVVAFGLRIFVEEYLTTPITQQDIDEAEEFFKAHGEPFNREGWEYILNKYDGYLPLRIDAVPEGTVVPVKDVLAVVTNTDPNVAWLVGYMETAILRAFWYGTTVATNSWTIREDILKYARETSESTDGVLFKLHDFGARGVSSFESAGIGAAGHLISFRGSDTISGALTIKNCYGMSDMPSFSIPAAEHSTITSWGRENEADACGNMIAKFAKPGAMFAWVSDSYDLDNAIENIIGGKYKQDIINSGATFVVRPDSGDPVAVVIRSIKLLMEKFGFSVNSKGYKVLPNCIRVIQGDGIDRDSIRSILEAMKVNKLSVDNVAFGMGGALLQHVNRDTFKFAMKTSAVRVNGQWRDVYKDPITDRGKKSLKGRVMLVKNINSGEFETIRQEEFDNFKYTTVMMPFYVDGEVKDDTSFEEIRDRADSYSQYM